MGDEGLEAILILPVAQRWGGGPLAQRGVEGPQRWRKSPSVSASRCNLPISVVLVWVTNPLTMTPVFYFAYRLGAWLLDRQIEVGTIQLNWDWLGNHLGDIGWPLLFGSLVCGWVAGVTGMVLVRIAWRFHVIRRWRARRDARRQRQQVGDALVSRAARQQD